MKVKTFLLIALLAATSALAQDGLDVATLSAGPSDPSIINYGGPQSKLAMWIWTDKYTYLPGQPITLKWTVKTNNDLYPYVVIAYRQNNLTGEKFYLPGGGTDPTDINGNALAQGFQPGPLSNVTKAVLGNLTAPSETGMHTFVVQLRDYTGTRILKTSYMKIGVVSSVQVLSGAITTDRTLTNDTQWNLSGRVAVKNGATLTIEPGTFIIGQPGTTPPSLLLITRNGKISAIGTKSRPIIMTSSRPFGQRSRGDWGGLVMLGTSNVNVPANTSGGATCGTGGCNNAAGTFFIEGLVADDDGLYGGGATPNTAHNCGSLEYVRVEYAGSILSPNNELNSFTWGGCGTGTVADHLQAIYGLDDCFEWFGGTMNTKYIVGGLCADDYADFQLGTTGKVQYGLFYQNPDARGNRGVEGDNSEYNAASTPFSNPTFYNMTFVGSANPGFDEPSSPGIFLRRAARGTFNNMVVANFNSPAVDIDDANTQAQADLGNIQMNGVLVWNNNVGVQGASTLNGQMLSGPTPNAQSTYTLQYAQGLKGNGAGKNFVVADPLITLPLEYSDPDFFGRFGSPIFRTGWVSPPDDGFFDQTATFVGGIGTDNWMEEWTSFLVETDVAP